MKKICKMTWIKLSVLLVAIGSISLHASISSVTLPPPREIAQAKTQLLVDIIMPAYAVAEQTDLALYDRDPDAYADRFNRNNALYNRSIELSSDYEAKDGDTVLVKYSQPYNPSQNKYWEVISNKPPFIESVMSGEYSYIEHVKGVVRVAVKP
jgi:hypothetical protein